MKYNINTDRTKSMTKEEAITKYVTPAIEKTWNAKRCKEIIEALEQESDEDIISRKTVKSEYMRQLKSKLKDAAKGIDLSELADCAAFNKFIDDIPPINQQNKIKIYILKLTNNSGVTIDYEFSTEFDRRKFTVKAVEADRMTTISKIEFTEQEILKNE